MRIIFGTSSVSHAAADIAFSMKEIEMNISMTLEKTPRQNRVREALGRIYDQQPPEIKEYLKRYQEDQQAVCLLRWLTLIARWGDSKRH